MKGTAYNYFLKFETFVEHHVFVERFALRYGDFQLYGSIAHVGHFNCIGSRVKVGESVEAVDVAGDACVKFLNVDRSTRECLLGVVDNTAADCSFGLVCSFICHRGDGGG